MKISIKFLSIIIGAGILVFVLIQLVPFGHEHINPATVSEPKWSSPEARALVKQSCFQCHSNETNWTWYSNIAPASWLIQFDVNEGRAKFNFSDWNKNPGELDEMIEVIQEGEMPPVQYTLFHPDARLNAQQKQDLIDALKSSVKSYPANKKNPAPVRARDFCINNLMDRDDAVAARAVHAAVIFFAGIGAVAINAQDHHLAADGTVGDGVGGSIHP